MSILNRKEFSGLLTEWRNFLNEEKQFVEERYKSGEKVRIEICCDGCGDAVTPQKNYIKKGVVFFGTVKKNESTKDIKFSGDDKTTKVNMIKVDCDGEEFNLPQCCVNLGVKSQKNSNTTPKDIVKGDEMLYKGKRCTIKQSDIGGTRVLINIGNEEKSVNYNSLYKLGE